MSREKTPKTVLITGSSSGIGRATAIYFHERGWNVSATMRDPSREGELNKLQSVICPRLDVTDPASIASAVEETVKSFGGIDVVVNNAGYGLIGRFEALSREQIRQQYGVNLFGLIDVMQATIPVLKRSERSVIINISSIAGRLAFPLYSQYNGSKWAVEGLSEAMHFEYFYTNLVVKLVEPASIKTNFGRAVVAAGGQRDKRPPIVKRISNLYSGPEEVARVIYKASTDGKNKLRYPAGRGAGIMLFLRDIVPERLYIWLLRNLVFRI